MKPALLKIMLAMTKPYFFLLFSGLLTGSIAIFVGRLSIATTLHLSLFFVLLTGAFNCYNNIADALSDSITKPTRPFPRGLISKGEAIKLSLILYALAFAAGVGFIFVHVDVALLLFSNMFLTYAFSAQPFRFKRFPIVKGSILVAHTFLFPFLAVALIRDSPTSHELISITPLFMMAIATHTIHDYEDIEGDKASGDITLPILLGHNRANYAIVSLYLAALAIVLGIPHLMWPFTITLLLLQSGIALLLLRHGRMYLLVVRVNSLLSLATVISLLYRL